AYHQAIPLVCLLAAFYILLVTNWRNWLKMTWLLAIGTISGLAYISGAFSILAVAIILLVFCVLYPQQRPRFLCSGLVLLVAGAVTSMAQLWVIVVVQHGQTHRPHTAPWAFPDERQFWAFILGKIGRSLMLLPGAPLLSLKALFLFLLLSLVLLGLLFKRASQPRYFDERTISVLVISLSMVAAIGVYLFMVAAGRANFGVATKDANFVGIFVSGFARFHFFWVTVLWPWVFAIGVIVFGTTSRIRLGSGALALGLLVFAISRGAMSHDAIFRKIANQRIQNDLVCLQDALIKQKEIRCPTLNVRDLSRAYAFAVETGASFVKYFPLTLRSGNPNVATYSILSMSPRAYKVSQAEVVTASVDGIELGAGSDPKILFQTGHPDVMADCLGLQVSASITVGRADDARLFYMVAGQKEFEEGRSLGKPVPRNQVQMIDFVVTSHSGFRDRLRLDPVASSQPSKVGPITVRCLLSIPKDGIPKNNLQRPLAIARTAPTLSPQSPPSNVTDSKLADRAMSRSLSE
ncbi:MAG: hypothetical protein ACRERV_09035, partial [Methylococcales bacterium]